jgi:hypothetical protein
MRYRNSIKSLLKHLHRHEKSEPDIYIFALPRAGSTLLLEILNTNPRSKTSSEPLALNKGNMEVLRQYFDNDFLAERYVDISDKELDRMFGYFSELSQGRTWNSFYWSDLVTKNHQLSTQRTLFKTHRLSYYFDDFMHHFKDDYGLYLLRHPVAQAFSRMQQGWDHYIDLYAESKKIGALLSREARAKIGEVLAKGSQLEKFVLSWCLENYVYIQMMQNGRLPSRVFPVFYEDLVQNSERTIREICKKVEMEYSGDMLSIVNVPSRGIVHSTKETGAQIVAGNKDYLTKRWRDRIDPDSAEKVRDILLMFGITIYKDI